MLIISYPLIRVNHWLRLPPREAIKLSLLCFKTRRSCILVLKWLCRFCRVCIGVVSSHFGCVRFWFWCTNVLIVCVCVFVRFFRPLSARSQQQDLVYILETGIVTLNVKCVCVCVCLQCLDLLHSVGLHTRWQGYAERQEAKMTVVSISHSFSLLPLFFSRITLFVCFLSSTPSTHFGYLFSFPYSPLLYSCFLKLCTRAHVLECEWLLPVLEVQGGKRQ